MRSPKFAQIFLCVWFCVASSAVRGQNGTVSASDESPSDLLEEFIERGRTFVQGTLRRFMLIAPAIFFKLGIAFTLLLLVTLVAVSNGFIGFLILVVGLSSVLARLQGRSAPLVQSVPIPAYHALPSMAHHYPWVDRSDSVGLIHRPYKHGRFLPSTTQGYDSNADLRNTGVYFKD